MVNIYYIDLENTGAGGLKGIKSLNDEDVLNIFYSPAAHSLQMDCVMELLSVPFEINMIKVKLDGKDSMDFHIITKLFYEIKPEHEYIIISKDKGYDSAIAMGESLGLYNVKRKDSIIEKSKKEIIIPETITIASDVDSMTEDEAYEELQKRGVVFKKKYMADILKIAAETNDKSSFYIAMTKKFGLQRGLALYTAVKPEYEYLNKCKKYKAILN